MITGWDGQCAQSCKAAGSPGKPRGGPRFEKEKGSLVFCAQFCGHTDKLPSDPD
jgi:hypothetical protein